MLELCCYMETLNTAENSVLDIDHQLSTVCVILIYVLFMVEDKTVIKFDYSNR